MERPILEDKREITIVKKGFFYYVFQLIFIPFRLLIWLLKFSWRYLKIYLGWIKEYFIWKKKTKNLNKILSRKNYDGEII